jgi:hypothetical protein
MNHLLKASLSYNQWIDDKTIAPLQGIQNRAASILSRTKKHDRMIRLILTHLHWLRVKQRIEFKILLIRWSMVWHQPTSTSGAWKVSASHHIIIWHHIGVQAIKDQIWWPVLFFMRPRLWKAPHKHIREVDNGSILAFKFKRLLKSCFFSEAFEWR